MAQSILERILAREAALWQTLEGLPAAIRDSVPVSLSELRERVEAIDTDAVTDQFCEELEIADDDAPAVAAWLAGAARYEWYYDGREPAYIGDGLLFPRCQNALVYSKTDQVELGIDVGVESDASFEEEGAELAALTTGLVLEHAHVVRTLVNDYYAHEHGDVGRLDLQSAYTHAFDLTFYKLLHAAAGRL